MRALRDVLWIYRWLRFYWAIAVLGLCSCAPSSVFVTDVRPLPDGSISLTSCQSAHDLMGRHVLGECHTVRRRALEVQP